MGSEYSGSSCRTDEDLDSLEWVKNITVFSFLHEYGETATIDQLMEDQESLSHAALIDQVQLTGSQLEIWSALASSSLMVAECDLTHEHRLRLEHTAGRFGQFRVSKCCCIKFSVHLINFLFSSLAWVHRLRTQANDTLVKNIAHW